MYFSSALLVFLVATVSGQRIHDLGHDLHQINPMSMDSEKEAGGESGSLPNLGFLGFGNLPENLEERKTEYWNRMAQTDLIKRINRWHNKNKAKNIILFIGDGMSIPTLMAARTYLGQVENKTGEEQNLSFEKFPYVGLSKTYCANRQVADSACTATAYLCGIKSNFFTTGVNGGVRMNNCTASEDPANQVDSIAQWALEAGKATGIVTTTRVTHASPSGAYAHSANRALESDYDDLIQNVTGCTDIAKQLMTQSPGKYFDVIMGGGRIKFKPAGGADPEGERLDGRDFINEWKLSNQRGKYVSTRSELRQINYQKTDKILGLFAPSDLNFARLANAEQPTLEEMTESAIRLLSRRRRGYFLFVEGGKIDHGHHASIPQLAIDETLEFSKAIERARQMTSEQDTLIVVSSDHSHTMTVSGYPKRGNDILGLSDFVADIDNLPYATLSYANGPNRYLDENGNRLNLTGLLTPLSTYPATVPMSAETHGGDDVAVFASGPYAHLFTGLYEQHFIPHLMAYAACIGKGKTICNYW